ncbi:MAG: hypothetical protein QF685_01445 [Verrucomicrobiota bacterium]|jgi:hypothetical protein|nr:hypothetical protein [Verrucomicrobiota bacterium]
MIQLHTDCLVFETAAGETIPCSAQDVTVELLGDAAHELEPQMITEAAEAVLFYFKVDLGRNSVSVGEFTMALERILRGFGFKIMATDEENSHSNPDATETDLHDIAHQVGEGLEMLFFCTLRDQIHADLHGKPELLRVKGLRNAVSKLTGAKQWSPRCQKLNDQIVEYLRHIVSQHQQDAKLTLMIV